MSIDLDLDPVRSDTRLALIRSFKPAPLEGIVIGTRVTVPEGESLVALHQGQPLLALTMGTHAIDPAVHPPLAAARRPDSGIPGALSLALCFVKTQTVIARWESGRILTRTEDGAAMDSVYRG